MFRSLFPTFVLEDQLTGDSLVRVTQELDFLLENLKFSIDPEDDTGELLISDEGIKETNNIVSRYNLQHLDAEIKRCAEIYLKETNTVTDVECKIFISVMTLLKPGGISTKHMHQSDCLVAVYYHKTPINSGKIRLYTPLQYTEFQKELSVDITPCQGKILLFPGWLYHEVLKNESDDTRLSIAITMQVYKDLVR